MAEKDGWPWVSLEGCTGIKPGELMILHGRPRLSRMPLQNIPIRTEEGRRIREAFREAPHRTLFNFDYSELERRILRHLEREQHEADVQHQDDDSGESDGCAGGSEKEPG